MDLAAPDGTILKPGQVWISADGEFESLFIGVNHDGFPVFEKLAGWGTAGDYFDIEKHWKSMFLHKLKDGTG